MSYLLINKPAGITSHDVINRLRKITGIKKIGHAGTLDPFATGLLIVAVGRDSTKEISGFVKLDKEYIAVLKLGEETDTYDKDGTKIQESKIKNDNRKPSIVYQESEIGNCATGIMSTPDIRYAIPDFSLNDLQEGLNGFIGPQLQIPPMYSAKKVGGKKLYQLARQGKTIDRKPAKITITKIEILDYHYPILKILVACSSGTYIRSLAHDIGEKLGCGAYLEELERTKIGKYKITQAIELDKITPDNWQSVVINI